MVQAVFALDDLRPSLSLAGSVCFEPMSVRCFDRLAGGAVARDSA
jgi:hypothetical protein